MQRKILFLCFLSLLLIQDALQAQPVIKNQHAYGSPGNDLLTDMKITNDGGLIIGGYTDGDTGYDKSQSSRGGRDYWVVKTDVAGHKVWDKRFGGSIEDDLSAVLQTRDHGYLFAGQSQSGAGGDKTQANRGSLYDYWIVRTDSLGNKLWDKTIGGSFVDYFTCADTTSDGGFILGGYSASPASGEKTANQVGDYDYWIVKLDAAGNIQWDKTIGGNALDVVRSIHQTSDGGYILGGNSTSIISGNKTQDSRGSADYWLVKINAAGNVQWDKTIGGSGTELLYSVLPVAGGYLLGGQSTSGISGEKTEADKGGQDYWVVKTDNNGNVIWDKTIGGDLDDNLISMQPYKDNGFVLLGISYSNISGDKTEARKGGGPHGDYWAVKIDNNGNVLWDKTVGGKGDDLGYAVCVAGNNIILGGDSYSNISYDRTVVRKGLSDYWIVLLRDISSSNSVTENIVHMNNAVNKRLTSIAAYPNPANNIVTIQVNGKAVITINDEKGKTVLTKTINGSTQIDVSHLPPGKYYLNSDVQKQSLQLLILH